jgi:hypothetical protein
MFARTKKCLAGTATAGLSAGAGQCDASAVTSFRGCILSLEWAWLLALPLVAQDFSGWSSDEKVPPPPPFGVSDASGVYARDPEALRRMSDALRQLQNRHGYTIHVVVEPILISETPTERAIRFQNAWLPHGNGLVIVYESDSRDMGMGRWPDFNPADPSDRPLVPANDVIAVLSQVERAIPPDLPAEKHLEALVLGLVDGFTRYFTRQEEPATAERSLRSGLVVVGLACSAVLLAMGVAWQVRRGDRRSTLRFLFPDVGIPERLGAPFGGGTVTSRRFRGNGAAGRP